MGLFILIPLIKKGNKKVRKHCYRIRPSLNVVIPPSCYGITTWEEKKERKKESTSIIYLIKISMMHMHVYKICLNVHSNQYGFLKCFLSTPPRPSPFPIPWTFNRFLLFFLFLSSFFPAFLKLSLRRKWGGGGERQWTSSMCSAYLVDLRTPSLTRHYNYTETEIIRKNGHCVEEDTSSMSSVICSDVLYP